MDEILSKAERLEQPKTVSVQLRREVYQFLSRIAGPNHLPVSRVVRAIAEDFYDRFRDEDLDPELPQEDPDEEVTSNE